MADVKQWDVFPTKIFESQFKTTEEIKKYILQQEDDMINHAPTYTKQGADNELQKSKIFKPLVEHIHSLTENICKIYEYKYDAKTVSDEEKLEELKDYMNFLKKSIVQNL